MTSFKDFSKIAASRGEGLHAKLRELFERSAAFPSVNVSVRPDGMLQAGPNPKSESVGSQAFEIFPNPPSAKSRNIDDEVTRLRRSDHVSGIRS